MMKKLKSKSGTIEVAIIVGIVATLGVGALTRGGDKDGSKRNNPDWYKIATKSLLGVR